MQKSVFVLLAVIVIALGSMANANATTLPNIGHANANVSTAPVHEAACRGYGRWCGPGHHRVCRYGRCWCAPCW